MAEVTISNVRKVYSGNVEAVKGVSIDIPDGGFCVLVGPSGCGKSTLLRMVAGLESVTSGEIRIGGRAVNDVEPADRDIAMVFQNYALYPHMSVYDNMAYGLRNRGTAKDEIERRVREAAKTLAIEPFLDRKPSALSGGQRQRVAMGRAIVRKPQVFLFDEPLSNLDAKLRVQMRVEIKRLQRALGVTAIYVTHDQIEAMTLSDRLVVMNGGRVEQAGSAAEVYRRPATRFVAGFIGSPPMNLMEVQGAGAGRIAIGGQTLAADGAPASGPLLAGLRPEDVTPTTAGNADALAFRLDFTEELGPARLCHGTIDGHSFSALLPNALAIPADNIVHLAIAAEQVHLFGAESGERIN